jgi:hypothetical protein
MLYYSSRIKAANAVAKLNPLLTLFLKAHASNLGQLIIKHKEKKIIINKYIKDGVFI